MTTVQDHYQRRVEEILGKRDPFAWSRSGAYGVTELLVLDHRVPEPRSEEALQVLQVVPLDDSIETYEPFNEPEIYLEFARAGERLWASLESGDSFPTTAIDVAIDLTSRFGFVYLAQNIPFSLVGKIPPDWSLRTTKAQLFLPTVQDIADEAMDMSIALGCARFLARPDKALGAQLAVRISMQWRDNAQSIRKETREKAGIPTIPSARVNDGETAKALRELRAISDILERQAADIQKESRDVSLLNIRLADFLKGKVNQRLSSAPWQLSYDIRPQFVGPRPVPEIQWHRRFRVESLRQVIWTQLVGDLVAGSYWRTCANDACEKRVFRVERPRSLQKYCEDRCKEQANNRAKYRNRIRRSRHARAR